jgi:hypothetical protein
LLWVFYNFELFFNEINEIIKHSTFLIPLILVLFVLSSYSCKKSTSVSLETTEIENILASSQPLPSTPEEWVQQNIPDVELAILDDNAAM